MNSLLRVENLFIHSGSIPIFENVSFSVGENEVLGFAGLDNVGIDALANFLTGLEEPTQYEFYFEDKRIKWPFISRKLGIEVVPRYPKVVDDFTVYQNIFMGNEKWLPVWDRKKIFTPTHYIKDKTKSIMEDIGLPITLINEKAGNLPLETKQLITIARSMVNEFRVIIIDASLDLLSYYYQQKLLLLIQSWQEQGKAIIFSSNNLDHLFSVTDKISVFREKKSIATYVTDEINRERVVFDLVGLDSMGQITPIVWALDNFYRARDNAEKLRQNQLLLEQNLATKDNINKQLLTQLNQQIIALDDVNRALQDAQRRLHVKLEEERKSIARELHDQTIQELLSVNYQIEKLEEDKKGKPETRETLNAIRNEIRDTVEGLRTICLDLRPSTIDALGLGSAIVSFSDEWSKKTYVSVKLQIDKNLKRLPENIELSLFRIIQECLRNIEKHSKATEVFISLKHTSPRSLKLKIFDNGGGFPSDFSISDLAARKHFGILGMYEQIALMNGKISFQNQEGGVLIQAEIPHPRTR